MTIADRRSDAQIVGLANIAAINTGIKQNTEDDNEMKMDDIIDVAATAPNNGEILKYNENDGNPVWEAGPVPTPCPVSYNDRGDPSSVDFSKTAFTTDGQWHTLDLSSIVSEGATLVHLLVYTFNSFANSWIFFCKKGNTNRTVNRAPISIRQGGNIEHYESVFVACDENRQIEYMMTNRVWDGALDVVVRGWI